MNANTEVQFNEVIQECKQLFDQKTLDYSTAWRILRLPSLTDQIFIKARRIRSIQEKGTQMVADDIKTEFQGIINYCIIALIQSKLSENDPIELVPAKASSLYLEVVETIRHLLFKKNHDYDEAWRAMRISSMTDIILMKLHRIKQIEDNDGKTIVSEGITAGYQDIVNYAVFCLIKLKEQ